MNTSISHRFYFFSVSCCILLAILIVSILGFSRSLELSYSRENYTEQVVRHATTLEQILVSENIYASTYEPSNWLNRQQKLNELLYAAPELTPQQQTLQNSIKSQNINVKKLFTQINKNKLKNANEGIKRHLTVLLMTQLAAIKADSFQLASIVRGEINSTTRQGISSIVYVFIASMLILVFSTTRLVKIIITSLKEVTKAFGENHSGHFQTINLTYHSSEFDNIVNEFNAMNRKLSETTVSLEVLKKTVEERTQDLENLSKTDPLTKVANRRALFERGSIEFNRVVRTKKNLSIILLDCDFFKDINDKYGHLIGDDLLKHICKICSLEIRDVDFLGRYGGEEFIVILPDCDIDGGIEIAKRIQSSLSEHCLENEGRKIDVTLSMGISMYSDKHKCFEHLVNDADQAMYLAKKNGRNRIETISTLKRH